MYEIWVIYISIAKLLGSKHTIVCLVWCDVLNNLKMRLCETIPQLRWRTRMLVRYGPVWRYVGARVQWGGEGFGNRFEASRAARPEAEVIFGNFWLLLRLIVGFAWRFRRYTQTSITCCLSLLCPFSHACLLPIPHLTHTILTNLYKLHLAYQI